MGVPLVNHIRMAPSTYNLAFVPYNMLGLASYRFYLPYLLKCGVISVALLLSGALHHTSSKSSASSPVHNPNLFFYGDDRVELGGQLPGFGRSSFKGRMREFLSLMYAGNFGNCGVGDAVKVLSNLGASRFWDTALSPQTAPV